MFTMRFDMRVPNTGAPSTELYAAALEMASWAETRGCLSAVLCEHHMSADGYLPAPTVLAGAMAARTTTLPIMVAALILPLYDPIRLAEEMLVIDVLSGGRVSYVAALGYRPEEYELFGVGFHRRGRIAEALPPTFVHGDSHRQHVRPRGRHVGDLRLAERPQDERPPRRRLLHGAVSSGRHPASAREGAARALSRQRVGKRRWRSRSELRRGIRHLPACDLRRVARGLQPLAIGGMQDDDRMEIAAARCVDALVDLDTEQALRDAARRYGA